jgi:hypothetical protein
MRWISVKSTEMRVEREADAGRPRLERGSGGGGGAGGGWEVLHSLEHSP